MRVMQWNGWSTSEKVRVRASFLHRGLVLHVWFVAWMEWQLPTPVDSERGVALPTPSSLHPIAEEEESTAVPSQVTRYV